MAKLLITGASGLTGTALLNLLRSNPCRYETLILSYRKTKPSCDGLEYEAVGPYDFLDSLNWREVLKIYWPDAILIISNIRHLPPLFRALLRINIHNPDYKPRLLVVGTTGVFSSFKAYSNPYKYIERLLSCYEGDYTLIRPSMIYGSRSDKNIHKLLSFILRYKFFVIFGTGTNLVHPVYFADLALAIRCAVDSKSVFRKSYNTPGLYPITYKSLVYQCFHCLAIKPKVVFLPISLGFAIAYVLNLIGFAKYSFTVEQLRRLSEDKFFDYSFAKCDLDYNPRSFSEGIDLQCSANDF